MFEYSVELVNNCSFEDYLEYAKNSKYLIYIMPTTFMADTKIDNTNLLTVWEIRSRLRDGDMLLLVKKVLKQE